MLMRTFHLRRSIFMLVRIVEFKVKKFRADPAHHVLLELELLVDQHANLLGLHIEAVLRLHRDGVHHPDFALVEADDAAV